MKQLNAAVEKHRQLILDTERWIWKHPETGYKEFKTSAHVAEIFEKLGYDLVMAEGITGFYTDIDTGRPGPTILILGELDSVICPAHKDADPVTGAVHSCGHNTQCAALVGIAAALKEPGILDKFCGTIKLCAVPAEELLEIEYRTKLKNEGKIRYLGGKSEFLSRGYFDGVDIAMMVHAAADFTILKGHIGCLAKQVIYKGVAAHAGGSPWDGRNALYAANCGLNAINAIRETFQEKDIIRVHPIMTDGGTMVNAIPETAVLESFVRGASFDGIIDANKRVNRALIGAALSLGTNIEIIDTPGYAPHRNDEKLIQVALDAAAMAIPEYPMLDQRELLSSGSTDMGDLSCIMPVVHPNAGGAEGRPHGNNYEIVDPEAACVGSAKLQLGMLLLLLQEEGKLAKEIAAEYKPQFSSKEAYLSFMDELNCCGDRVVYNADETAAQVKLV